MVRSSRRAAVTRGARIVVRPGVSRAGVCALVGVAALRVVAPASAQCELRWTGEFAAPGSAPAVLTSLYLTGAPGAGLYIGGWFDRVGGTPAVFLARQDERGWREFGSANGTLRALVEFDEDGPGPLPNALYLGGSFTSIGGMPINALARWDGTGWTALGGGFPAGQVFSLAIWDDGSGPALYAGGDFAAVGGVAAENIARWRNGAWSALAAGVSGYVRALAPAELSGANCLAVGGSFHYAGGISAESVAAWTGSEWQALGAGLDWTVNALASFDDGAGSRLYAGGDFLMSSGRTGIARWTGSAWTQVSGGVGPVEMRPAVHALRVYDDGSGPALYVGGRFRSAGALATAGVARWNGTAWSALAAGLDEYADVKSLSSVPTETGPKLLIAGHFYTSASLELNSMALWNGTEFEPTGQGLRGGASEMAVHDDGSGPALYINTAVAGGRPMPGGFARWDGIRWRPVGNIVQGSPWVLLSTEAFGAPILYAGGLVRFDDGLPRDRVIAWDGQGWTQLGPALDNSILAMAIYDHAGQPALHIGGRFGQFGGPAGVARWDGTTWRPLGSGLPDGLATAMTTFDSGDGPELVVTGIFDGAGVPNTRGVARWNGAAWRTIGGSLAGTAGARGITLVVVREPGGPALYLGGVFDFVGAVPARNVARWNGQTWTALGSGTDAPVLALAAHDDGTGEALYACGQFTLAGDVQVAGVARWDGAAWSGLGEGVMGTPNSLASFAPAGQSASLYVGGLIHRAGGVASSGIARWGGVGAAPIITGDPVGQSVFSGQEAAFRVTVAGATGFRWLRSGAELIDDARIHGSASAELTITNALPEDAGLYSVRVVNGCGELESASAQLRVLLRGDLNCDGAINNLDVDSFVLALSDAETYAALFPDCDRAAADTNGDGRADNFDIDPFVECLLSAPPPGQPCP